MGDFLLQIWGKEKNFSGSPDCRVCSVAFSFKAAWTTCSSVCNNCKRWRNCNEEKICLWSRVDVMLVWIISLLRTVATKKRNVELLQLNFRSISLRRKNAKRFRPFYKYNERNYNNYHGETVNISLRLNEFIFLVHPYIGTTENSFVYLFKLINFN